MLTEKQRLFVSAYLVTLNATEAAKQAGYAHPQVAGPRLKQQHPKVRREIQKAMDKRKEKLEIDADFVLRELLKNYEKFTQAVKPALNSKTGKPITDEEGNALYRFDGPQALKALELIGKHIAVNAWGATKVQVDFEDEMIARLEAARARVADAR